MIARNVENQSGSLNVVVNDEGQYALCPEGRELAPGWHSVGVSGDSATCAEYVERHWADLRPLSLRGSNRGHSEPARENA
jgi:uncharacterized protein YbdZ (MbtH family)